MCVLKSYKLVSSVVVAAGAVVLGLAGGCADDAQPARTVAAEQPGVISARVFDAPPDKVSTLLNFETVTDMVFVSTEPADLPTPSKIEPGRRRGGLSSLQIAAGTTQIKVKLSSLISGRQFPGEWTLVGGHFYVKKPTGMTVQLENEGGPSLPPQHVRLEPDNWTDAMIDITPLAGGGAGVVGPAISPTLVFKFDEPLAIPAWCDDVELIDNTNMLVNDDSVTPASGEWSIRRKGYQYIGSAPGRFAFKLKLKQADPLGWECVEANSLRARFTSAGQPRELTIYVDGRSYSDGRYTPIVSKSLIEAEIGEQHQSPAEVTVPAEQGKLDRGTPGDENNDGYNEARGAYELVATGQRLEATIAPRTAQLVRPVLEIAKFPPGKVLVTLEGKLVEKTARLADGTLLVELPGRITRPTVLTLRLQ